MTKARTQQLWGARVANPWFAEAFGEHLDAPWEHSALVRQTIVAHRAGKASRRDGMACRAPQAPRATPFVDYSSLVA